ncbi:hypothetical protein HPB52_017813 [Rhipicephalus sanguineus]|uniref:Uncharacterized protein n=1 Tax=Rhipicephalus sanguineus TaxID=34632 RepID=A0A9D4Q7L1_RHISA|nr:hypothetical protein HPB52_017813 [Rhipicephalus sanguineus]
MLRGAILRRVQHLRAPSCVANELWAGGEWNSDGKKDWHDLAMIKRDAESKGLSAGALWPLQATFSGPEHLDEVTAKAKLKGHADTRQSSRILYLRKSCLDSAWPVGETCQKKRYVPKLPTASVIVLFHSEHWTTLLRTATSVLSRSPPELIEEIILSDVYSNKGLPGASAEKASLRHPGESRGWSPITDDRSDNSD